MCEFKDETQSGCDGTSIEYGVAPGKRRIVSSGLKDRNKFQNTQTNKSVKCFFEKRKK